jgi:hypothetical protein
MWDIPLLLYSTQYIVISHMISVHIQFIDVFLAQRVGLLTFHQQPDTILQASKVQPLPLSLS